MREIEIKIFVLALVITSVLLPSSAMVYFIPNAYAINNTQTIAGLSTVVELGSPFYVEHYQDVVEKPQSLDNALLGTLQVKGYLMGT